MKTYLFLLMMLLTVVACTEGQPLPNTEQQEQAKVEQVLNSPKWVMDDAKLLKNSEIQKLSQRVNDYQKSSDKKPQIVVLTVPNMAGKDIETFSSDAFKKIKIGNVKHDNGILIVIALQERKLRIEVGYGFEGVITDTIAAQIIRERMVPNLRKGSENWYRALDAAVSEIISLTTKENS